MDTAQRRATYEDLLQVPDHLIAEVVNGELITAPRPASAHARAASALTQDLGPFDRSKGGSNGPGGWWILFEPELHLDSDILVPDLAGWRRERMPVLEDVPYFTQTPDWVCEIVSPSTARTDRVRKMPIYAREQVGYLWLVDPSACTLEVYRHRSSAAIAGICRRPWRCVPGALCRRLTPPSVQARSRPADPAPT